MSTGSASTRRRHRGTCRGRYTIPAGVLAAGRNVIAVRISNVNGRGGFVPDPAPQPGFTPLPPPADGARPHRNGHRRRGLHCPARRRVAREGRGDLGGRPPARNPDGRADRAAVPAREQPRGRPVHAAGRICAGRVRAGRERAAPSTAGAGRAGAPPTLAVTLSVVVGQMKFDRTTITARAGQRVEITFTNIDDMPHNVVIFKRGSMATYEKELFGSMNEPNAQLRGFVPDSPNVLFASPLLNARESALLDLRRAGRARRVSLRVLVPGTLGDDAWGAQSRVKAEPAHGVCRRPRPLGHALRAGPPTRP